MWGLWGPAGPEEPGRLRCLWSRGCLGSRGGLRRQRSPRLPAAGGPAEHPPRSALTDARTYETSWAWKTRRVAEERSGPTRGSCTRPRLRPGPPTPRAPVPPGPPTPCAPPSPPDLTLPAPPPPGSPTPRASAPPRTSYSPRLRPPGPSTPRDPVLRDSHSPRGLPLPTPPAPPRLPPRRVRPRGPSLKPEASLVARSFHPPDPRYPPPGRFQSFGSSRWRALGRGGKSTSAHGESRGPPVRFHGVSLEKGRTSPSLGRGGSRPPPAATSFGSGPSEETGGGSGDVRDKGVPWGPGPGGRVTPSTFESRGSVLGPLYRDLGPLPTSSAPAQGNRPRAVFLGERSLARRMDQEAPTLLNVWKTFRQTVVDDGTGMKTLIFT